MWHRHEVSKCCWKSGADRLAQHKAATSLQFEKKNTISMKWNTEKCNKMRYDCMNITKISKLKMWGWWWDYLPLTNVMGSLIAQTVKNLPAKQESRVWSLRQKDLLREGTGTHSSILAWRIPWPEEPGGLQCMGSQRVRHDWVTNTFLTAQGQEPGCDKHAGRGESCPEGASVLVMHGWGHILALP